MYEQSLGIHSCVCGEIYPSLAPESSSPRRTREPDSYVYGHLKKFRDTLCVQTAYFFQICCRSQTITIPKCKQPQFLKDMCTQKLKDTLNDVLGNWVRKLCLVHRSRFRYYRQQVLEVTNECSMFYELLT